MKAYPNSKTSIKYEKSYWDSLIANDIPSCVVIREYIYGQIDIYELSDYYSDTRLEKHQKTFYQNLLNTLISTSMPEFLEIIRQQQVEDSPSELIPSFSRIDDAIFTSLSILSHGTENYTSLGYKLPGCTTKNDQNCFKYGETHSKLLALLDLAWIESKDSISEISISPLGTLFRELPVNTRSQVLVKLIFRIPIIRNIIFSNNLDYESIRYEVSKWMNGSSVARRTSSVNTLVSEYKSSTSKKDKW